MLSMVLTAAEILSYCYGYNRLTNMCSDSSGLRHVAFHNISVLLQSFENLFSRKLNLFQARTVTWHAVILDSKKPRSF